jgi:hypothetical protein
MSCHEQGVLIQDSVEVLSQQRRWCTVRQASVKPGVEQQQKRRRTIKKANDEDNSTDGVE